MALEKFKYKGKTVYCPKHDRVFKALFDNGEFTLLASFLSCIFDTDIRAEDLAMQNTELPPEDKDLKMARLDLRIMLTDGSVVNVEMQVRNEHDMGRRSLYNLAKLMPRQLKKQGEYRNIRPVIAINILDFDFIKDSVDYINRYRMKNLKTNAEMPDAEVQEIIFIELPKLPKRAGNLMEWWLKFLTVKTGKELDMVAAQHPMLAEARDMLLKINADPVLRDQLDALDKAERDYNSSMARRERIGREKAHAEIAKNMKAQGFDSAVIAGITGLSVAEIEKF
jgi:predicted transposase/invertase (TIGR01784 family)